MLSYDMLSLGICKYNFLLFEAKSTFFCLSLETIHWKLKQKKQKQKQASMIAPIPHEFFRVSIDSAKHWTITTVWRHTLMEFRWRWWRLFVKSWFVVCYHHSHITHRHRHRLRTASVNLGSRPRKGSPKK